MKKAVMHPTRRAILGLIGATVFWPRRGRAEPLQAIQGYAFGTTWRIAGGPGAGLERIRPDIEALFEDIGRQMSPWRDDSVLSRFNAGPAGWRAVDDEVAEVTRAALALARDSGGAFDPTVGPLVARWGFGPIHRGGAPDWRGLAAEAGRIAKTHDDLTVDLCGIAKGRALDRAADIAAAAGLGGLLLDLGGELRAIGQHPSGRSWRVAVQHPESGGEPPAVLRLASGQAVATSGRRNQSCALGAQHYAHIIDPAAQTPADDALWSVTVLASDAMTADGWATALFAAGATGGPALARERGIAALFLVRGGAKPRQIRVGAIGDVLL